jgi:hypothetical protein
LIRRKSDDGVSPVHHFPGIPIAIDEFARRLERMTGGPDVPLKHTELFPV